MVLDKYQAEIVRVVCPLLWCVCEFFFFFFFFFFEFLNGCFVVIVDLYKT
jgi:hypothetical protein